MTTRKEYHFHNYRGRPAESNHESTEFGGAYINFWISNSLHGKHTEIINIEMEREGWILDDLLETAIVTRRGYIANNELSENEKIEIFELLDQADQYGLSWVFYTWNKE